MATRSRIGLELKNGSIISVYHHWDGGPNWLGRILKTHYNTKDKVAELIDAAIARHQQSRHNIGRFVDALGDGVMEVERLATADLNRDLVATLATAAYGEPVS